MKKSRLDQSSVRFGQRVALEVPVRLGVDGRSGRGIIRNASMSGALLETALELPLHTSLLVTLTISDQGATVEHALNACVVRVDPAGVGIEWRDMGCTDVVDLLDRAS
jgi:hypothetical protein